MRKFVLIVAGLAVASATVAAQQTKVEKAPIKPIAASDAAKMFDSYCAACHGKEGKGNGPAAKALTKAPADLTKLAANNKGAFPEIRVKRFIEGADEVAAHGTRDMPMWGDLFNSLNRDTTQIRIQGLSDYIKTMQQK